jgi:hypothetical protein
LAKLSSESHARDGILLAMRTHARALSIGLLVSAAAASAQAPRSLSDSAFGSLIARFSEPSGYFDTDNLISNEDSYLHPMTTLRRVGVTGGVYVGVGPDQNFSYIAAIRPHAAVIIDIRRDNLLEHLLFKSIFARSRNRAEYLSLLFGKPAPADTVGWGAKSIDSILAYVSRAPASGASLRARAIILEGALKSGVPLSTEDARTIVRFHDAFVAEGPALRFTSYGRAPSAGYPDFAQLATERDLEGKQRSFLATEEAFQFVKSLEDRNLVIPVVGNFAGSRAFYEVGKWMAANNEKLSALYASNVEQYLDRDRIYDTFAANLLKLPRDSKSVIIRSCFNFCRERHPNAVASYYSVQMTALVDTFASLRATRRINGYFDVVSVGLLPP